MMTKTVSQKMGVKENSQAVFVNAEKEALENTNLPTLDIHEKLEEELTIFIFLLKHKQNLFTIFLN